MDSFKYRGVVEGRNEYNTNQRVHMIKTIGKMNANLYMYYRYSWESSYQTPPKEEYEKLERLIRQGEESGVDIWVGFKPGDFRYCFHKEDRSNLIGNAQSFMDIGAKGIFLAMDDTHPAGEVRRKDALYQRDLLIEMVNALGENLKAVCGEQYHGRQLNYLYWEPILTNLPQEVMMIWTGPNIWCKSLCADDFIKSNRPILLFDNYFASDTPDPKRAPTYPYNGRNSNLTEVLEGIVIHPNTHYPWQYPALRTTLDFMNNPGDYNPTESFAMATLELGDLHWNSISD